MSFVFNAKEKKEEQDLLKKEPVEKKKEPAKSDKDVTNVDASPKVTARKVPPAKPMMKANNNTTADSDSNSTPPMSRESSGISSKPISKESSLSRYYKETNKERRLIYIYLFISIV